jgi:hypothetical protein
MLQEFGFRVIVLEVVTFLAARNSVRQGVTFARDHLIYPVGFVAGSAIATRLFDNVLVFFEGNFEEMTSAFCICTILFISASRSALLARVPPLAMLADFAATTLFADRTQPTVFTKTTTTAFFALVALSTVFTN